MKKTLIVLTFLSISLLSGHAGALDAKDLGAMKPEGVFSVTPIQSRSCIAVEVPLKSDEALAGVKWYNNDDQTGFPYVLVSPKAGDAPMSYDNALAVTEDAAGGRYAWSQVDFDFPVGSASDGLFLIFQLPANDDDAELYAGPGIGYRSADNSPAAFISHDGKDWVKIHSSYHLLVEPEIIKKEPGMVELAPIAQSKSAQNEQEIPKVTGVRSPYPNPFNPVSTIEYSIARPQVAALKIFDVRGRLVKTLVDEPHSVGNFVVEWRGENESGARTASGVYFVQMRSEEGHWTKSVVLLK